MHRCKFLGCLLLSALVRALPAMTFYWTGAAGDGKWDTKANWRTETADPATKLPTYGMQDVVYFDVAEPTTIDVESRTQIHQFMIASSSAALTFTSSNGSGWLEFFCNNGNTYSFPNVAVQDATNVTVCCSNAATCVTTFDCSVTFRNSGNIVFGPGCVFNKSVALPGPPIFSDIRGVIPCTDAARTVFNEGWTSYPQSLYLHSARNELVIDRIAGSNTTRAKYWYYPTDSEGKMTIKGGYVVIGGSFSCQSSRPIELNLEGGRLEGFIASEEIFKYFRRTGGDLSITWPNGTIPGYGLETDGIIAPAGALTEITRGSLTLFDRKDESYFVDTYQVNAPLYLTNSVQLSTVSFNAGWLYEHPVVTGPGAIYAPYMKACGASVINTTLCVGKQFQSTSDGGEFVFSNATIRMYGDLPDYTTKAQMFYFDGDVTIDTLDCMDGATSHTAVFKTCYFEDPACALTVKGGGTVTFDNRFWESYHPNGKFIGSELSVEGSGTTAEFLYSSGIEADTVRVGAGAALSLDGGVLKTGNLVLGAGSTLSLPFSKSQTASLVAGSLEQQGAVTLNVTVPSGTADGAYLLVSGVSFTQAQTTINITDETGKSYAVHYTDGEIWLAPDGASPIGTYEWTGATSGKWNLAGNWTTLPVAGATLHIGGFNNLAMQNDFTEGTIFDSLNFRTTAGPFSLSGNGLVLTSSYPVVNQSLAGQTIKCGVTFSQKTATLLSPVATTGGLMFKGWVRTTDGDYTDHLYIDGLVGFGGDTVIHKLMFRGSTSKLRVLSGGRVKVINQTSLSAQTLGAGTLDVEEGGVFEWAETNAKPFFWSSANTHTVDGQLIVSTTYGASDGKVQTFSGTGRLDVKKGYNYLKNQTLPIQGGLHLNNNCDFPTANADGSDSCAVIALDASTLGALTNWTYGPASAVTDRTTLLTTPAQRALRLTGACTIDTQNPDTGEAHTITFTDPIDGSAGSLVKTGAGTLVLAPDADTVRNDFSGGLELNGGTVLFATPSTTFAADKVVFSGGRLAVTEELGRACRRWTTILRALSVEGDIPEDPERKVAYRVVAKSSGYEIQACYTGFGFIVIFD